MLNCPIAGLGTIIPASVSGQMLEITGVGEPRIVTKQGRRTWLAHGAVAVALAVGGCGTSSPFSSASSTELTFINASQTWDLDKNGTVTCDEWKQYATSSFKQADGNGDGALDAQEWSVMVASDRLFETAGLSYYDANADGKVTLDELANKPNTAFALLDKNKDCQIGHDEAVTMHSVVRAKTKDLTDPTKDDK